MVFSGFAPGSGVAGGSGLAGSSPVLAKVCGRRSSSGTLTLQLYPDFVAAAQGSPPNLRPNVTPASERKIVPKVRRRRARSRGTGALTCWVLAGRCSR